MWSWTGLILPDTALRILMIAPTPYFSDRGCHVRIYEEARALCSLGHDVRIVTYHIGRDMPGIPVTRIPAIPWYTKLEAGPSWHKLYLDLLLIYKSVPLAFNFRPHIIHSHLHEGLFIGYFLKKLFKTALILDYQGSLTGECVDHGFFKASSLMARIFRRLERMINNFADRIVTSSSAGVSELITNWGIPPERVIPVIDGVDTDIFQPLPQHEGRQQTGIPANIPVVAYLGILSRYQGSDLLLDCISILKAREIQAHFLIMGFPCERYKSAAIARGISDMITFTGKIEYSSAPLLLSAADIAISPKLSLTEANGKLFNYMACALPTVVFDTPVNREVLGDTGVYARYGEAQDMADKIINLLQDHETRRLSSKRTREKAVREHSWKARGRRLVEVYRGVMGDT